MNKVFCINLRDLVRDSYQTKGKSRKDGDEICIIRNAKNGRNQANSLCFDPLSEEQTSTGEVANSFNEFTKHGSVKQ